MIFRATYKLAEHVLNHHETKVFQWDRGYIFLFNFLVSITLLYIYYYSIRYVYVFLSKICVCVMVYVYMLCVYTMCMPACYVIFSYVCLKNVILIHIHKHVYYIYSIDCHNRSQFLRLPRCKWTNGLFFRQKTRWSPLVGCIYGIFPLCRHYCRVLYLCTV